MVKPSALWITGKLHCRMPALTPGLSQGFTLTEVLVTLAMLAVLLTIGLPSLASLMESIRVRSAGTSFLSHLHLARSEAIKRNTRVALCKSADGVSCTSSGGWEQGWLIFQDVNKNAALDDIEVVIARSEPLAGNLKFTGNFNVSRYVSFVPSGATQLVSGAFQAGTFTLCSSSASRADGYQIILNAAGRLRMKKVELSACA